MRRSSTTACWARLRCCCCARKEGAWYRSSGRSRVCSEGMASFPVGSIKIHALAGCSAGVSLATLSSSGEANKPCRRYLLPDRSAVDAAFVRPQCGAGPVLPLLAATTIRSETSRYLSPEPKGLARHGKASLPKRAQPRARQVLVVSEGVYTWLRKIEKMAKAATITSPC
jgi:hypothetical protein